MFDHLTGLPIAKAIPDKEDTTIGNAIYGKLILEHTYPKFSSDNGKKSTNNLLPYAC